MTTDNCCFYLQNRQIQTCQTGGQLYSDNSPFSVPWYKTLFLPLMGRGEGDKILAVVPSKFVDLSNTKEPKEQGTPTERGGSVQLTSLFQLV